MNGFYAFIECLDSTRMVSSVVYRLIVHFLTRDWINFIFIGKKDALWIIQKYWFMDNNTLELIWKQLFFNAREDFVDIKPIWVKIPWFPLE